MRSIYLKIALLLTVLLVCMTGGEVAVRLIGHFDSAGNFVFKNRIIPPHHLPVKRVAKAVARLQASDDSIIMYDQYLGWRPRPGARSRDGLYSFNSQGLRSPRNAFAARPDSGVLRIALFGDSFIHSDDVPYEESLGALLTTGLTAAGTPCEVLNFGVGGYGLDQALLRFLTEGKKFAPDVVVLGFQPEDLKRDLNLLRPLYDPRTRLPLAKPRYIIEDGGISLINVPVLPPEQVAPTLANLADWPLLPHEYFYDAADYQGAWWQHSKLLATFMDLRLGHDDTYALKRVLYRDQSEAQRLGWALVQVFHDEVTAAGARFLIVHLPTNSDLEVKRQLGVWPYETLFAALGEQYSLSDPGPALLAEIEKNGISAVFKGHYTLRGNQIVAAGVQDLIAAGDAD